MVQLRPQRPRKQRRAKTAPRDRARPPQKADLLSSLRVMVVCGRHLNQLGHYLPLEQPLE